MSTQMFEPIARSRPPRIDASLPALAEFRLRGTHSRVRSSPSVRGVAAPHELTDGLLTAIDPSLGFTPLKLLGSGSTLPRVV